MLSDGGPQLVVARPEELPSFLRGLDERIRQDEVRYYLCAGAGPFRRPPWSSGPGLVVRGETAPEATRLPIVESILYCREAREAALERELRSLHEWAGRSDGPPTLVLETIGAPGNDEVAFLQACRLRVPNVRLTVVRHVAPADTDRSGLASPSVRELLLGLLFAGGSVPASELSEWSRRRGWAPDVLDELTSTRDDSTGTWHTYAGAALHARAWAEYATASAGLVAELAAMVTSTRRQPLLATAALVTDPELALAAFSPAACADAGAGGALREYGANLFRTGRRSRWAGVPKRLVATICLAVLVAGRKRIEPGSATALLGLAEQFGVDPEDRSQLAYALGQLLAKGPGPEHWETSIRCFDHVRDCLRARPPDDAEAVASRTAAAYNSAALAYYRAGDHGRAVEAELAGLDVLEEPGVLEQGHLYDQQVLLLTNLASVYGRTSSEPDRVLDCYRRAWRISLAADSLAGLSYTVTGLVRALLAAGEYAEAEQTVEEMLRRYDAAPVTSGGAERAAVTVCTILADVRLAEGATSEAAGWYAEAVRRMRRPMHAVINGILQNLRAQPKPPPHSIVTFLEQGLATHLAVTADLETLLALSEGTRAR